MRLRFASSPYINRVGLFPLIISISAGWVFVILWGAVSIYAFTYNNYWSVVLGASTLAFASFLGYMSYSLVRDAFQEYVFELTESEAVLYVHDKMRHKKSTFMILLDDVRYAEYYPYSDSSSIILHAPYYEMEVPLWPLGRHGQDVVDFLSGRGINVVNVQSDDRIPDCKDAVR
jgi:hypothetical protein